LNKHGAFCADTGDHNLLYSTGWTVLKLYFNINQLANQRNSYNLLILISSYEKLFAVLIATTAKNIDWWRGYLFWN